MRWLSDRHPASLLGLLDIADDAIITTQGVYMRGFELLGMDSEHQEIESAARAAKLLYREFAADVPEETLLQFMVVADSNYRDVFARFEAAPEPDDLVLAHQRRRRLEFLHASNLRRFRVFLFVGARRGFDERGWRRLSDAVHRERLAASAKLAKRARRMLECTQEVELRPLDSAQLETLYDEALNPTSWRPAKEVPVGHAGLAHNPTWDELTCRERLVREPVSFAIDHVRLGRRFAKVLSLKALPAATQFTMMEILFHLNFDFRASINLLVPQQAPWLAFGKRRRRLLKSFSERDQETPDEAALARAAQAQALEKTLAADQRVVLCGMQVAIFGQSLREVEARTDTFTDHLKHKDMVFFEENGAHDREVFKTLPGMADRFDRWRFATSHNAVDLMPLFLNAPGDARPVFLVKNDRHELFSYDPMEPARQNWNSVILGASGAGKSVLMNMLITTAMLSNLTRGRLTVVDFAGEEKSSYLNVVRLFGGLFVPLLSSSRRDLGLNPFLPPQQALTPEGTLTTAASGFLTVITDILLANTGTDQEALLQRAIIGRGMVDLYRQERTTTPLYVDLYAVLKGYVGHSDVDQERLKRILALLRGGVLDNPAAHLLTKPSNLGLDSPFAVLDLFGVNNLEPRIREALVFSVCHHVTSMAFEDSDYAYKYIVLDEVAQLLRTEAMTDTVKELYATARKHNTSIWTATQKYEDYVESAVASTIALNSTTNLFLSHKNARDMEELVISSFRLRPREAHLFRQVHTKKGAYSQAFLRTRVNDARRNKERDICAVLNIELSPFDYELATTDPQDRRRQRDYLAANPQLPVYKVLDYLAYRQDRRIVA